MSINSRIDYPSTIATADQTININGLRHYFVGDSEVKCDEGDNFNSAFGKELAETNAQINMLKEYKRVLISLTKQPEWRKEKKLTLRELTDMERDALDNLHKISNLINKFKD
jgi:hypothetical protein